MRVLIPCLKKLSGFNEEYQQDEEEEEVGESVNQIRSPYVNPENLMKVDEDKSNVKGRLEDPSNEKPSYRLDHFGRNDMTGARLFEEDKLEPELKKI